MRLVCAYSESREPISCCCGGAYSHSVHIRPVLVPDAPTVCSSLARAFLVSLQCLHPWGVQLVQVIRSACILFATCRSLAFTRLISLLASRSMLLLAPASAQPVLVSLWGYFHSQLHPLALGSSPTLLSRAHFGSSWRPVLVLSLVFYLSWPMVLAGSTLLVAPCL